MFVKLTVGCGFSEEGRKRVVQEFMETLSRASLDIRRTLFELPRCLSVARVEGTGNDQQ